MWKEKAAFVKLDSSGILLERLKKTCHSSVRIAGNSAVIRTRYLPNESLQVYLYTNLLSEIILKYGFVVFFRWISFILNWRSCYERIRTYRFWGPFCLSSFLSFFLSFFLSLFSSFFLSFFLSFLLSFFLSFFPSFLPSFLPKLVYYLLNTWISRAGWCSSFYSRLLSFWRQLNIELWIPRCTDVRQSAANSVLVPNCLGRYERINAMLPY
jgi:hypothetical protein